MQGFGDGEFVQVHDTEGNVWRGHAERDDDGSIRFHFCDSRGDVVSGLSDSFGIVLRDARGNIWRGFLG